MTPNGGHNHTENNNSVMKTPASQNRAYSRPELVNIASLVTLLDRKDDLLAELTAMNNQAEKMVLSSINYDLIIYNTTQYFFHSLFSLFNTTDL